MGTFSFSEIISYLAKNSLFIFAVGAIIVDEILETLLLRNLAIFPSFAPTCLRATRRGRLACDPGRPGIPRAEGMVKIL